jgi:ComEC/Rec2-related protein
MMTIVLGGWALKRPSDLLNSLAAAAFVILLWDPRQLFAAGFQLSFAVVLVIALMLPPLNKFIDQLLRPDPLRPHELLPGWWKAGQQPARMLARYAALSFAAWIGSLPLSAKYFHLFTPVSTLANILAVPLGTLALMANLGALVCGHWLPWITVLFNHAAWFFMSAMTGISSRGRQNSRRLFLRPRTVAHDHYDLLRGGDRPFQRLVQNHGANDFRRGHNAVDRRILFLAMAVVPRGNRSDRAAAGRRPCRFRGRRRAQK